MVGGCSCIAVSRVSLIYNLSVQWNTNKLFFTNIQFFVHSLKVIWANFVVLQNIFFCALQKKSIHYLHAHNIENHRKLIERDYSTPCGKAKTTARRYYTFQSDTNLNMKLDASAVTFDLR